MVGIGRPKLAVQFPRVVTVLHCPFLNRWRVSHGTENGAGCLDNDAVSGLQPVGEMFLLTSPFIDQVKQFGGKLAGLHAAIVAPHSHRVFSARDALDQFERHEFLIGIC